ncbi:potassium-transporting ATPase [Mycobacterium aquaticum]|nr:potassium-transporting ATPase [Mycobacterium aquaticum]
MSSNGDSMSVLIYIVLTVAIFAVLGLVQRLVERL